MRSQKKGEKEGKKNCLDYQIGPPLDPGVGLPEDWGKEKRKGGKGGGRSDLHCEFLPQ